MGWAPFLNSTSYGPPFSVEINRFPFLLSAIHNTAGSSGSSPSDDHWPFDSRTASTPASAAIKTLIGSLLERWIVTPPGPIRSRPEVLVFKTYVPESADAKAVEPLPVSP